MYIYIYEYIYIYINIYIYILIYIYIYIFPIDSQGLIGILLMNGYRMEWNGLRVGGLEWSWRDTGKP